jgi:hypothetical protein
MSITLDEVIKAVLVNFYWETVPQPTRQGAGIFVNYLMDHLRGPGVMRNARDAASQCSAPWVENATLLQRRLREALVDFYDLRDGRQTARCGSSPSRRGGWRLRRHASCARCRHPDQECKCPERRCSGAPFACALAAIGSQG